jgi:leader peptidase (prepilin peptidase) / N-methyltransferase
MTALRYSLFALFGLAFGSFLTVVIYRIPRGESVVTPGSACPSCGVPIRPLENVPLLSFVVLRGHCRRCGAPISLEYPLTEAATSALFVGASLALSTVWQAALVAPFVGLLLACAIIDYRKRIIPNAVVLPALAAFAAAILALDLAGRPLSFVDGLLGLLAYGGGLFVVALVSPGGMGMGDVKLAALIGLVLGALGLRYVGVAAMLGILTGGVGAVVALALGRDRKEAIPFGPYLALGAAAAVFTGPAVAGWYAGFFR